MARQQIIITLVVSMAYVAYTAKPLFDREKCPNGCRDDEQCPKFARCNFLDQSNCGFCECQNGYKAQGNKCNPIKGYSTTTTAAPAPITKAEASTSSSRTSAEKTTTTTEAPTTTSTTQKTTTGTTQQPANPPAPEPLNCGDYDCATPGVPPSTNDDNPLQVRSALVDTSKNSGCKRELVIPPRKCNLKDGGQCFGIYCLSVSSGNDYCICPSYKVDRQCAVDKPGRCSDATGQVPAANIKLQNKRLRNQPNKDHGSVYGRHFCANLNDCIKLCQWSGGACRSVNFGQINGANVCEMLSIAAKNDPKSPLYKWLEDAPGWQHAQVGQANN